MEVAEADIFARATAPANDARPMPRALLVFAHPDDETIALGARLRRFAGAHLLHVTDGVPANGADSLAHGFHSLLEYRSARWQEMDRALELADLAHMSRERFDIPDQEASFQLSGLTRRLAAIFRKRRPQVIFTHPYEGGHPDHDACAFAVHHAISMLRSMNEAVPLIVEAPFYHAGSQGIETGVFLPADPPQPEVIYPLSAREQQGKRTLLSCFTSQQETLQYFGTQEERYRVAPAYDFRRPPHWGGVFYDNYSWGIASPDFCKVAAEAEDALDEEMNTACC